MALEITYYTASTVNENMYGIPISSETRTTSGTSAQSGATPANAVIVRIKCITAADRFAYGANPTATATAGASGHYLAVGDVVDITAVPGNLIAAILSS